MKSMNHPAQPAPEGATSALRFTIIALLADERRGCDHKHLDDLLGRYAALRARCERLEGALKPFAALAGLSSVKACDDAAEPFMTGADILGNRKTIITVGDIRKAVAVYNDALAQPEDGK